MAITKITTGSITDGTIATADIADGAVTSVKTTGVGGTSQIVFTKSTNDTTLADDTSTVLSNSFTENFKIGSSMTYSSNIWSFPSTGVYEIHFGMNATVYPGTNVDVGLIDARIQTTTDNSSYSTLSRGSSYINGIRDGTSTNINIFAIFDVTDTSTHKVRFAVYKADNTSNATTAGLVHLIFKKIADT